MDEPALSYYPALNAALSRLGARFGIAYPGSAGEISVGEISAGEKARPRRRRIRAQLEAQHLFFVVLFSIAYFFAAEIGLAMRLPGSMVFLAQPANAVLLAALLVTPPRQWWLLLFAIVPTHLFTNADIDLPIWRVAWQIAFTILLTISVAAAVRFLRIDAVRFAQVEHLMTYGLVAVIALPAVISLLSPSVTLTALETDAGEDSLSNGVLLVWWEVFLSNALVFLIVVPAITTWLMNGAKRRRPVSLRRRGEAALLIIGLTLASVVAFDNGSWVQPITPAQLYAPIPFLLWAATRFGLQGIVSALCMVTVLAFWKALHGGALFAASIGAGQAFHLQLFMLAVAAPLMVLSCMLEERRVAALALQKGHSRISELATRLITAQEAERSRIARDLHDDLSQQLAAISIALSNLKQHLPKGDKSCLDEVASLQAQAINLADTMRNLSHELHPSALRHAGIGEALRGLCKEFGVRRQMTVDFSAQGELTRIPPDASLCLYRATQEALRNAVTHAHAQHVGVHITSTRTKVELIVADDGCGFDLQSAHASRGLGLISLDERVRAVSGVLSIESTPGCGTRITTTVPLAG